MKVEHTHHGLELISHPEYPPDPEYSPYSVAVSMLVQTSSRAYPASLWFGKNHHLSRDEVIDLIAHLQSWVDTESFIPPAPA